MCGIAGFLQEDAGEDSPNILGRMAAALLHRGPDDGGIWHVRSQGIGLAHRRLSILDTSAAGHQPMASAHKRYVIAFNGEIYNHLALRQWLEQAGAAPVWHGHSDTETLLAAFEAWGVANTLPRLNGMFAIALWDTQQQQLTLARDRAGEKPLYWGWQGEGRQAVFLFGSELAALARHPQCRRQVDRGALSLLLRHKAVPAPHSIYQGISKLMPGCWLSVSLRARQPQVHCYWSASAQIRQGIAQPFGGSAAEAVTALDALLRDAVGMQMLSDVPLGAFLSGGIDSSLVVAQMQAQSARPVKTFTIGFDQSGYNEAEQAKAVARHLGTDHTELYVSANDALALIPKLPVIYSEPFADSSQIPTWFVANLARQQVTVALSGDAGDELFAGYNRYPIAARLWGRLSRLPLPLRHTAARLITLLSPEAWNRMGGALPGSISPRLLGEKLHKGASVLGSVSAEELYYGLVSHWRDPASIVIGGEEPATLLKGNVPDLGGLSDAERMMALDLLSYLPDDILAKVDRAAMANSLETRVPLLDHRLIDFAWSLPLDYKMRDGQTKWPLRQVLKRYVPDELVNRPKMGFGVPLAAWLRGPLRDWAETLLAEPRLRQDGYFQPAPIRERWTAHLSGRRNWAYQLWDVLMFNAWLDSQR